MPQKSVRSVGNHGEARKQTAAVTQSHVEDMGWESQPTGPTGEPGGPARSFFDIAQHRNAPQDPAADEAFRDTVSLQPFFGGNNLLGEKPYDEGVLGYLAGKRDFQVQNAFQNLALTMFDPLDPAQRMQLNALLPGLEQSKMDTFEAAQEQRAFLNNCAMKTAGGISPSEWSRLVRILGGAEMLKISPIDIAVASGAANPPVNGILGVIQGMFIPNGPAPLNQRARGVLSFLFPSNAADRKGLNTPQGGQRANTRGIRETICTYTIQHFPRYLQGAYDAFSNGPAARQKLAAQNAAVEVVNRCEAFVDEMRPLGDVAARLAGAPGGDPLPSLRNGQWLRGFTADGRNPGVAGHPLQPAP